MLGLGALGEFALGQGPAIMPAINVTGVMAAQETPDTFLGGGTPFNPAQSAEIGVVYNYSPATEVGVSLTTASGVITSAKVSIRIS